MNEYKKLSYIILISDEVCRAKKSIYQFEIVSYIVMP